MKNYKLVSAILGSRWLLEPTWLTNNLTLVNSILQGQAIDLPQKYAYDDEDDEARERDRKVTCLHFEAGTFKASRYSSFDLAPEGSIAVIPVIGPVLKYDDGCGGVGSSSIAEFVNKAAQSSKIGSIILKADTPGGQVDGTPTAADAIKAATKLKPVLGFVDDGILASAGVWMLSGVTELYASQKTDSIGSIGVYTQFADLTEHFKQKGIVIHQIYSDRSKDKNKDYRDALEGDDTAVKEDLNFIADEFISTVKINRKGKLNLEFDNPFTGKMYHAEEAVKIGLIDGILPFDAVVKRAEELSQNSTGSSSKSNPSATQNPDIKMKKISIAASILAVSSFFKKAAGIDSNTKADEEKEITAETLPSIVTEMARLEKVESDSITLKAELDAARSDLAKSKETVSALEKERDEWKTKAEEYGGKPGDNHSNPHKKGAAGEGEEGKKESFINPKASHNASVAEFLNRF